MYPLNLPEQTVAAALNSLSEQTDIPVLFPYDIASQHQSRALVGNYPLQQALHILLLNTGLHAGLTDSGVITISRTGSNVDINQNGKGKNMNTNKRKTVLATMVGLFAAGGMSATMAQGQVGFMNTLVLEGQKYGIKVNALAPAAATRMTTDLGIDEEALDLMKPEAVSAGLLTLCHKDSPNRLILCAGAGGYASTQIYETEGIILPPDEQTPEAIMAQLGAVTEGAGQKIYQSGAAQSEKFVKKAMALRAALA